MRYSSKPLFILFFKDFTCSQCDSGAIEEVEDSNDR